MFEIGTRKTWRGRSGSGSGVGVGGFGVGVGDARRASNVGFGVTVAIRLGSDGVGVSGTLVGAGVAVGVGDVGTAVAVACAIGVGVRSGVGANVAGTAVSITWTSDLSIAGVAVGAADWQARINAANATIGIHKNRREGVNTCSRDCGIRLTKLTREMISDDIELVYNPDLALPSTSGLIRFCGISPRSTLTASSAVRRSSSTVDACEKNAVCGVMMTFSADING